MNRLDVESIFVEDSMEDDKENSFGKNGPNKISQSPMTDLSNNSNSLKSSKKNFIIEDSFEQDTESSHSGTEKSSVNTVEETDEEQSEPNHTTNLHSYRDKNASTDEENSQEVIAKSVAKKIQSDDEEIIPMRKNTKNVIQSDDSFEFQPKTSNTQKIISKETNDTMLDDSFDNVKSNITHFGKANQNESLDIIELSDTETNDIASSTQYINPEKTPVKSYSIFDKTSKLSQDKPLSSWSPNYEKVKASIKAKMEENAPKKIQIIDLEDEMVKQTEEKKAPKYEAPLKNTNRYVDSRSLYQEEKLKILSDRMIEVLEEKPEADNFIESQTPGGLKVSLLPHQKFSMLWLKWREGSYPNGGILADDMGLGKTLTILSYLKMVKDEHEAKLMAKLEQEDEQPDDEELNTRELLKRAKKKRSKKITYRLKTLIVLPASLLYQWQGEIQSKFEKDTFKIHVYHDANRKRHAYNLDDNDLVFTTYEIVSREVEFDKEGNLTSTDSPLTSVKWKRIILDEAHRIKNHTTKANKAMCALRAKYRIAITGTPIHNSLNDLYSLVKFLHFSPMDDYGLWKYVFADEKASNKNNPSSIERLKRLNSWMAFLSDYLILRRTKADKMHGSDKKIVDLPDKNIEIIRVKLNTEEKTIYDKIFNESKEKVKSFLQNQQNRLLGKATNSMSGSAVSEIFVYLLRLRQACCHLSLLSECLDISELQSMKLEAQGINDLMENMTLNGMTDTNSKFSDMTHCLKREYLSSKMGKLIEMVEKFLSEYPDDKLIVVSQWTSVLSLVAVYLRKNEIEFCEITGQVNLIRRNEIVEEFNVKTNTKLRIMLLSLTAGGVGLNLVGANRMFIMDIHWNPALEQQAMDRIYRVGQRKECFIYRILCENTIEERIEEIQHHKLQLAQKVCGASAANIPGMAAVGNAKLTIHDFKLLFKDFDNN
ncbi:transcription termination factor 2 isoform X1 [Brachionus plicatilis]|uniref:Transcription termination factor 2 isoform X1 n=1 Tax=Brachionus plicatilis TaxID=10195 RepID=A0A3M7SCM3_BRAPC|nr:transcription termination factor 2 isoform X1 [Brachionus plicatilis]